MIRIKLRPEIEARLTAEAKARGVEVSAHVESLLEEAVSARATSVRRPRTPEDIRAWLDSLAQFSDKIPPLPETISREWIYQGHD
jgi:hypothetical protein